MSQGLVQVLEELLGPAAARRAEGMREEELGRVCVQSVLVVLRRFLLSTPPPRAGTPLAVRVHPELAFHLLRFPGLAGFLRMGADGQPAVLRGSSEALMRELEAAAAGDSQPEAVAFC